MAFEVIPDKYLYLVVDLGCLLFPLFFSFFQKFYFINQIKKFLVGSILTGTAFIVWDIYFTSIGVWSFNPRYVCGLYLFNLPVEEVLFFFFIPYASVFTWHCMHTLTQINKLNKMANVLFMLIGSMLAIIAALNLSKLYTSYTGLLAGFSLIILAIKKPTWSAEFLLSFLLILIPFFVSNGILTGAFTPEPVVLYNNTYNLHIRMGTIPIEDTFYGMLLILGNIAGFHIIKR